MGDFSKSFTEPQKILELIVENSVTIQKGESIIINPNGLLNSKKKRRKINNEVLFGYFSDLSQIDEIDYELPPNPILQSTGLENNSFRYNEKNEGVYFCIYYKFNCQNYFIKDYEKGYGTFIKIENEYKIKDNSLFNIGDSYLVFTFNNNENNNENINNDINNIENINNQNDIYLSLKAYSGSITYEPIIFKYNLNKEITIGRSENSDVILQDKMLSRIHCILFYDENKGWLIKDGNELNQPSTNGTWVFAYDECEIYDEMIFKSNSNLFSCHLRNISNGINYKLYS